MLDELNRRYQERQTKADAAVHQMANHFDGCHYAGNPCYRVVQLDRGDLAANVKRHAYMTHRMCTFNCGKTPTRHFDRKGGCGSTLGLKTEPDIVRGRIFPQKREEIRAASSVT